MKNKQSFSANKKAKLILEDGTKFEGTPFGAVKSVAGEVVFTTGMVGYDLSLTDPSYAGQILTFTYPQVGNWGVPPKDVWESDKIQVTGVVISDLTSVPSHWQSERTLDEWLQDEGIPGIYDIDTRRLTQKLREHGVMLGKIVVGDQDIKFYDPNLTNLVADVSPKEVQIHQPIVDGKLTANQKHDPSAMLRVNSTSAWQSWKGSQQRAVSGMDHARNMETSLKTKTDGRETTDRTRVNIALLNCGAKKNILRNLLARGATVYELPWDYDPFDNHLPIDGLVISNGPGDPKMADCSIAIIKKALAKKIPTFGICLGNQLLALAAGGDTYKLKFGHRAQNQPTLEVGSKRCFITTQNHGFAVDEKKMPHGFRRWFYNANDNTNEGIIHEKLPFFSVQFHPEASPGPKDTEFLFDYFLNKVKKRTL